MGTQATKLSILIAGLLSLPFTFAAEAGDVASHVDETLTVIGRAEASILNIAANVNVIDSAEIQMSGATNLTELLRGQSGLQVSDNNSGAVFALRGFSAGQAANNTLILVDGRRLNNIDIAAPSINAIPLNQVERVEILSGSAGVLYGDQAVGGVINIITKAPNASGGSVQVSGGSFDTYEGRADVSGAINQDWRYYLAGSYQQSENYRDNNDNETGSILGRVQYQTTTDKFFVETGYYDDKREAPGALTQAEFEANPRQANEWSKGAYYHNMTTAARMGYQHQLTQAWALAADVNYSDTLVVSKSGENSRSLLEFNPKAMASIATRNGELNIIAGADVSRGEADFDLSYMQRSNVQQLLSAYVQADVPLTQSLSYVVGGRYSDVSDSLEDEDAYPLGIDLDEDASALELGLNYRPSHDHRFYLRAESNFRFAKVDEQAYTSPGVLGLKPQTGRSYEAGWDWSLSTQTLSLNLYRLALENEIVFDASAPTPIGGNYPGANVNADQSRRYGADLDWDWQLSRDIQLGLEYNYTDAEFTAGMNQGKALSWVAKHTGRGYVSVDIDSQWQVFAEAQYTGERFIEGDNANLDPRLDDYVLTNLALNYSHQAWLASLRVDNLFDKDYVSAGYYSVWGNGYYSGTGRAVRLSASYRF
ncbi:TonB-dependent receptor [Shewanella sp. AS16]|uniref:TonB-dependent receptor n=1 Tax=Shewanella sp. AS16 TaxID=2907625 RepID=UPI001F1CE655|nr:TonB-dependent receptor [Shewanella sp. AS16]MCE9685579.1 TonB-dependent receptor [Shewanella sp. AS16]